MEYLHIISGKKVGVRQVSTTPLPSRMHYEHVRFGVGGSFVRPDTFTGNGSFEAVGLSKGSVLTAYCFQAWRGGLSFDNCSSARILLNHVGTHSQGVLRVKGTQSDRSGFFGVLTGHTRYRFEDNQSFVGSDLYVEQINSDVIGESSNGPYVHMSGSPALPAGRVTMSSPRVDARGNAEGPQYEEYFTVDNYRGRLSSVLQRFMFAFTPGGWEGVMRENRREAYRIVCSGEAPLDVLLMANPYDDVGTSIDGGSNVTGHVLGCSIKLQSKDYPSNDYYWTFIAGPYVPIPNVLHADSLRLAALALDDFRELGEQDLALNHGVEALGVK